VDLSFIVAAGFLLKSCPLSPEECMSTAVAVFARYMARDEAEHYAAGLPNVTKGVEIVVTPEHVTSIDTGKDETPCN
jgi:hypothetical protein